MDHRKVTLLEVARAAGVSRATVSLVVRKSPLVAEDTRKKVEQVMAELDYVRDLGAARLRSNSSHTIGVIVPNLVNSFFTEFLAGVEQVMEEEDRVVLLANSQDDTARQNAILQRFRGHGVDGVIMCPAEETDPDLPERLQKWGLAVVQSLREVGHSATDYAGADYSGGIFLAIQHLVSQGHQRIAFLSVPARTSAREERLDGVASALALCGAENAGIVEAELSWQGSEQSAAEVMALPGKPTAVLCFNDILATGLMLGLRRAGCEPGRDIAVIGLDGLPLAELTYPPLTSVAVDPAGIGTMAARLLARRLILPDAAVERSIVAPRLIVRESSGFNLA